MSESNAELLPLTEEHIETLRGCVGYCCELSADMGLEPEEGEDTPEIADHIVRWWHLQPETERPDAEMMENALGAAVGEYLRFAYRLKWAIIKDDEGEAIVLTTENPMGELVLSPFDAIAEYLPDSAEGFVTELVENLSESEEMEGLRRTEDEDVESIFPEDEEEE